MIFSTIFAVRIFPDTYFLHRIVINKFRKHQRMDLCLYFPFIDLSLLYLYASIIAVKIKDIDCNKYQSGVEEYTK